MSKIIKGLLVIIVMATIVSGSSRAYFTDQNTIANNTFATGTVKIDTYAYYHKPINATSMAPGQEYFGNTIVINKGTLPVNFFMKEQFTGGSQYLYDRLMIRLYYNEDQNKLIYEGPVKDVNNLQLNLAAYNLVPILWESGGVGPYSIHLYQKIWLPSDADNSYKDLSTTFDEIFTANQYLP